MRLLITESRHLPVKKGKERGERKEMGGLSKCDFLILSDTLNLRLLLLTTKVHGTPFVLIHLPLDPVNK